MEDAEGGEIERAGPFFAGAPELPEEGPLLGGEGVRALDPPVGLGILGGGSEVLREEATALLGVPVEPALRGEVGLEEGHERVEVEDVGRGIGHEDRREGPAAPVGTLARLVERDAEPSREERREADLLLPEKLRGEHRVEDLARVEAVPAREEPQVVVGAVQEEAPVRKEAEEGSEVESGERIDEPRRAGPCELQETDLLEIVVEGVGLGVERDVVVGVRPEILDEAPEGFGVGDEAGRLFGVSLVVC